MESAGPAVGQALAALAEVGARPGETVGRVRLSVPDAAMPYVLVPVLPTFRARHPRIEVEVVIESRLVDISAFQLPGVEGVQRCLEPYAANVPGFDPSAPPRVASTS